MTKSGLKLQKKVQLESMVNSIVPVNMTKMEDPNVVQSIYRETKKDKEKAKKFINVAKRNPSHGSNIKPKKKATTSTISDDSMSRGIVKKAKIAPIKKKRKVRSTQKGGQYK